MTRGGLTAGLKLAAALNLAAASWCTFAYCQTVPEPPPQAAAAGPSKVAAPITDEGIDITSPRGRETRWSAYTLPGGVWDMSAAMMGMSGEDVYGQLGVRRGMGSGVELGSNLLHLSAGFFNLGAKWTIIERRKFAIATAFSPSYAHGKWLWPLSGNDVVGKVDVLVLPVSLYGTYQPLSWLEFDLESRFTDVEIFGSANEESLLFDANIAYRSFVVVPTMMVHVRKRTSFYFSARVHLWTQVPASVDVEVEVEPGVVVGGRASGSKTFKAGDLYSLEWGARASLTPWMYATLGLNYGELAKKLYGTALSPTVRLQFRF